jgi:SAM-dependent methyltransferase
MTTAFDDHKRTLWAGRATAYEQTFAKLCAHPAPALLDAVGAGSGVRLLDVGTGPGTVAALACARGATVVAVDAEPTMVELARHNVPLADVRDGTLPDLPFPDNSFDCAVANFVIGQVGDPPATLAELRRLVRPGGRIAVTTWPYPPTPLHELWDEVLDAAGVPTPTSAQVGPTTVRNAAGLTAALTAAGLSSAACETIEWRHRVDAESWWVGPASGVATIGHIVTSQRPEKIAELKQEYLRLSARYRTADGLLALPTSALLATAAVAERSSHR